MDAESILPESVEARGRVGACGAKGRAARKDVRAVDSRGRTTPPALKNR